jgi:hypothetical protein
MRTCAAGVGGAAPGPASGAAAGGPGPGPLVTGPSRDTSCVTVTSITSKLTASLTATRVPVCSGAGGRSRDRDYESFENLYDSK